MAELSLSFKAQVTEFRKTDVSRDQCLILTLVVWSIPLLNRKFGDFF